MRNPLKRTLALLLAAMLAVPSPVFSEEVNTEETQAVQETYEASAEEESGQEDSASFEDSLDSESVMTMGSEDPSQEGSSAGDDSEDFELSDGSDDPNAWDDPGEDFNEGENSSSESGEDPWEDVLQAPDENPEESGEEESFFPEEILTAEAEISGPFEELTGGAPAEAKALSVQASSGIIGYIIRFTLGQKTHEIKQEGEVFTPFTVELSESPCM